MVSIDVEHFLIDNIRTTILAGTQNVLFNREYLGITAGMFMCGYSYVNDILYIDDIMLFKAKISECPAEIYGAKRTAARSRKSLRSYDKIEYHDIHHRYPFTGKLLFDMEGKNLLFIEFVDGYAVDSCEIVDYDQGIKLAENLGLKFIN